MFIRRRLQSTFFRALDQFPAVMITGPRQAGKTTFVREELKNRADYLSFDDPFEQQFAREDPRGFLKRFSNRPVILDEIQYAPELLRYIKIQIDENRSTTGRWILTGSQHFNLMRNVQETLAGRIAILELYPLSLLELPQSSQADIQDLVWNGLYPDPALGTDRNLWIVSYISTYLQRDVRDIVDIRNMHTFKVFLSLCAARHGQELNYARLARECGVSQPTVRRWIDVLEASYILTLLPPFHRNFGKRLIKTPKLYFIDPALVSFLTRQPSPEAALAGAMGGALFEGLIVSEALKLKSFVNHQFDISYWRSHDGLEVDLIISTGNRVIPVEIKLSASPTTRHGTTLDRFRQLAAPTECEAGTVICRVSSPTPLPQNKTALPWSDFSNWLRSAVSESE